MRKIVLSVLVWLLAVPALAYHPYLTDHMDVICYHAKRKLSTKIGTQISKLFVLTDSAEYFLERAQLARLEKPSDETFDYYVLVVNWNVPMIKNNIPFAKYKYVRLEGTIDASNPAFQPEILAVYPTVQTIDVAVQNVGMLSFMIDPTYNGASAGSVSGSDTTTETFNIKVPVVCGLSTDDGHVRWTFYPQKGQNIILGNKSHMVLLRIPKAARGKGVYLSFNAALDYKLNINPPFTHASFAGVTNASVDAAEKLQDVLATHLFDMPAVLRNAVQTNFTEPK